MVVVVVVVTTTRVAREEAEAVAVPKAIASIKIPTLRQTVQKSVTVRPGLIRRFPRVTLTPPLCYPFWECDDLVFFLSFLGVWFFLPAV